MWRPARLRRSGAVAIRHARAVCAEVRTSNDHHRSRGDGPTWARLALRAVLDVPAGGAVYLRTRVAGTEHVHSHHAADGENRVEWDVDVADPHCGGPCSGGSALGVGVLVRGEDVVAHALGDQPLCDLEMEAVSGGKVHDRRRFRIGFRSVEMRRWVLYINGERLFTKGANLLPTTQLLGTASLSEVAGDIRAAHKPGLDLVRPVAHIARAEFYETADELGVLIWQHLPIRVVMSRSVVGEARREAREAVDLLGHHPSVAVWCAHDDPFPRTRRPSATPAAVSRLGRRGTATARPAVEQGAVPLRQLAPGGGPHRRAAALPVPGGHHEPAVVRPPRRAGRRSGPHAGRMPTMGQFVSAFGTPVSADQPEVVKMTIEDLRRLKYRPTGGFLLHALADVGAGPGRSESAAAGGFGVLDGLRRPKPGWQALVDACRPLVAAADRLPASVQGGDRLDLAVHVVNDTRSDMDEIPVRARVLGPGNIVISGQRWAGTATADDCVLVGRIDAGVPLDTPARPAHRGADPHR